MTPYERVFSYVTSLSRAYRMTFGDGIIKEGHTAYVLEDLAKFCHANTTTLNERQAGRREVWLRIQEQLRMTPEQLMQLNSQRLAERIGEQK